jgi:hypothetical protein
MQAYTDGRRGTNDGDQLPSEKPTDWKSVGFGLVCVSTAETAVPQVLSEAFSLFHRPEDQG